MFSCGKGDKGQLGIGFFTHKEYRPILVRLRDFATRIKQVECGSQHTLFLTTAGQVFAAGFNDEGQLGYGDRNIAWPEIIEDIIGVPITEVAAGRYSSAVDHKGQLYVWGRYNGKNQETPIIPDCL